MTDNPLALREWLQHAYEEALDQAVYLKRAIEKMDEPAWIKVNQRVCVRPNQESGWWYGNVSSVRGDEAHVVVDGCKLPFKMQRANRGLLWELADLPAAPSFAMHKHVGLPDPVQPPNKPIAEGLPMDPKDPSWIQV